MTLPNQKDENEDTKKTTETPPSNPNPPTQPAPPAQQDLSQLLTHIAALPEQIAKSVSEAVKPPKAVQQPPADKPVDKKETVVETLDNKGEKTKETVAPTEQKGSSFGDRFRNWWFEG